MRLLRRSLRARLVAVGMAVVAIVVVSLDVFVYASTSDRLEETLEVVLQSRLATAMQLADEFGVEGLGDRMADAGIPGVVALPDGSVEQAVPEERRFVELPPDLVSALGDDVELATAVRDDGTLIEVAASRAGINRTLRTIVILEGLGSLAAVILSGVILHQTAGLVLRPINRIVEVARSTAAGEAGARLRTQDTAELGRMAAAFNEMLDSQEEALAQAHAAEHRSRDFLAEAAHQLRTPIAGLRASAETLALTDDPAEREVLTLQIGRASARAGRLVSRLLRLAELDEGRAPEPRALDVGSIARQEVQSQASLFEGLAPRVEVDGDVMAVADEAGVRDVVANLVDNARRHGAPPVRVAVRGQDDHVVIEVADGGPGIPVAEQDRVFERFVSLAGDGSGLGLAIVNSVAAAHAGDAEVDGSTVRVRLPRG